MVKRGKNKLKFLAGGLVALFFVIGAQQALINNTRAVDDWTLDNIQGNNITSVNNPGGYQNNTPSQSPDNGTNFSPAFGNSSSTGSVSLLTVNGSGFPAPDFNIDAKDVQGGVTYACYLSNAPDSWLYCWGRNSMGSFGGSLGDGTLEDRATPVPIARGQMSVEETIETFSVGAYHACVITNLNKTYCWGYNVNGQLGNGVSDSGNHPLPELVAQGDLPVGAYFQSISAGLEHTCAVSNEGKPYCWGANSNGELGQNNTTSMLSPKKVRTASDGGSFVMPDTIKQIDAGSYFTCAIASNDAVYCWGKNDSGRLGDNSTTQRRAPVKIYGMDSTVFDHVEVGTSATCAITNDGKIYCWGNNNFGQLGNGTNDSSSVPIMVSGGITFSKLGSVTGSGYSGLYEVYTGFCAISVADAGYCWGAGYIGNGSSSIIGANVPTAIKTASSGGVMPNGVMSMTRFSSYLSTTYYTSACAVTLDNKVYCWGYSTVDDTVLGNNTYGSAYEPSQVVQFVETPRIQFDDVYGIDCKKVIIPSTSKLQCAVMKSPDQGLHNVLVTYHGETKILQQSYMWKSKPSPPTNLTAVGKNKMVHLEWDWQDEKPYIASSQFIVECQVSGFGAYMMVTYWGCDPLGVGTNGATASSSKNSDVFGLKNGVSYDFNVYSMTGSVSSDRTNISGVTTQASPYVPSPPTITNATASGNEGTISWSPPLSDGGSAVSGYMLMQQCSARYTNGVPVQRTMASFSDAITSASSNSDCLNASNPAQFSVIAFNTNGASEPSDVVELWGTTALKPPSAPSNIKVNNVNTDQTMLSWSAPSNNGSAITSYEMRYSTESDFSDWTGVVGTDTCVSNTPAPPTTSCVTNSLTLGTQYYFQIRALNANGASNWSIIHASVVGAPDRPIISTVSTTTIDSNTSRIYVEWNPPNNNGASITKYQLEYSTDPNFTPETTTSINTGTTPNYTLTPATNGTIYYFRVLATNSRGDSPYSDPVQAIPYAPPTITSITPDTGLTLGNELITITGANLNGTTSVTIGGIACLTFSVIDSTTINCLTPPNDVVGPKDVTVTNLGGSATEVGGFTYGDPQLTLNLDKTDLNIAYTGTGDFGTIKTDQQTATVKTNDPRGYVLNFSMSSAETALVHTSLPTNQVNASNALVNAQPLADNTWGYTLQSPGNNQWLGTPPVSNPKVLKTTTNQTTGGMTGPGDSVTVTFGAKITMTQLAGEYTGRMVYTAVGNY